MPMAAATGRPTMRSLACPAVPELLESGREVRVFVTLLHGQEAQSSQLEQDGGEVLKGDLRDPDARAGALEGVDEVVNLAAIVGDPACARDPELSEEVN